MSKLNFLVIVITTVIHISQCGFPQIGFGVPPLINGVGWALSDIFESLAPVKIEVTSDGLFHYP